MDELKEQVKILQEQIKTLMDIFGFAGYIDSFITDNDDNIHLVSEDYKKLNRKKLPVHKGDFDLLLKHLKLEIQDEKIERKVIPIKMVDKIISKNG